MNSPTDLNLPPYAYNPLVKILAGLHGPSAGDGSNGDGIVSSSGGGGGGVAQHIAIPNLTHEMTPADLDSPAVSLDMLSSLAAWISSNNNGGHREKD